MPKLIVKDIHTFYDTSHILFGVSLEVNDGECVCLLGRNGVGKTTSLKTIMGIATAKKGSVTYGGREVLGLAPFQIARLGIGYVPDERLVFPDLSVRENLEIGSKPPISDAMETWSLEGIYGLFPELEPLAGNQAGYLSGGEQQMLSCGRTLMGNPTLLLLDEPVEGLAPVVVQELSKQIKHLKSMGLAILFAEQNLAFATSIADRAYVIEGGEVKFEGSIAELESQPRIKEKYLMV